MIIPKILTVKALEKYKIYLQYENGTEGVVDLGYLAHKGVFEAWEQDNLFSKVYIDTETFAVAWNETLELCPDNLYLRLTKQTFEYTKLPTYASN